MTAVWSDAGSATAAAGDAQAPAPDTPELRISHRDPVDGTWTAAQTLLTSDTKIFPSVDVHEDGTAIVQVAAEVDGGPSRPDVFRCTAGAACGDATILSAPALWLPSTLSAGPRGGATIRCGAGCRTEECYPRQVMARSLPPAS